VAIAPGQGHIPVKAALCRQVACQHWLQPIPTRLAPLLSPPLPPPLLLLLLLPLSSFSPLSRAVSLGVPSPSPSPSPLSLPARSSKTGGWL
jgi:hypothetical protein